MTKYDRSGAHVALVALLAIGLASCGQPSLKTFTLQYQYVPSGESPPPWPPSITIRSDGAVHYEFSDCAIESSLPPERVAEVRGALQASKFFDLRDTYDAPATDLPEETIQVQSDGRTKTVRINIFRGLDRPQSATTPPAVSELFRLVLDRSDYQKHERGHMQQHCAQ